MTCENCGHEFPEHLFERQSWSFSREHLCPICNRALRNSHMGLAPDTPFPDEESNKMYSEAVQILNDEHSLDLLNDS